MEQEIRLVCTKGGDCEHLLQNGAEGKLVRLPENVSPLLCALKTYANRIIVFEDAVCSSV